jgi:prepilin signal peptidase PulO-like enzyme (type II secretory pathway)
MLFTLDFQTAVFFNRRGRCRYLRATISKKAPLIAPAAGWWCASLVARVVDRRDRADA